ncbi:ABC transporter-like protein [Phyllosticta citricarpa]|uniref:ABC transporter-like protein n=1 Tax=Phyllosticta citricarpa TaxID=55181 RepID=A0ABR1M6C4_9PEZI
MPMRTLANTRILWPPTVRRLHTVPLIRIKDATFYRSDPSSTHSADSPPLFPNLNFSLHDPRENWAILSPSSIARTAFLDILRGRHVCVPPDGRSYPYLASEELAQKRPKNRSLTRAIQYVGPDADRGGLGGTKGAYMSARYESMREATDWSLRDYLIGKTHLNASEDLTDHPSADQVESVLLDLSLLHCSHLPVSNLSNGQTRRARLAKAILAQPELLLIDMPFQGLDPITLDSVSRFLYRLATSSDTRVFLALHPHDYIPDWVTHFVVAADEPRARLMGPKRQVFENLASHFRTTQAFVRMFPERSKSVQITRDGIFCVGGIHVESPRTRRGLFFIRNIPTGDPIVEMEGVQIRYKPGESAVLGDWEEELDAEYEHGESAMLGREDVGRKIRKGLWWTVRQGERWGVFGPNGSGKTTLLSLITSDHPQAYSAPLKLFGRSRLPSQGQPGLSIFDIQRRIGVSSPEVHAFFPKHLSVRRVLESAWADTPLTAPKLTSQADEQVESCLRWFRKELNPALGDEILDRLERYRLMGVDMEWADSIKFGDLSFSGQRVALFLRAIIKRPDLVVLDEAFSGMDEFAREKCMLFLHHGERMSLRWTNTMRRLVPSGPKAVESDRSVLNRVTVSGLSDRQALIVVAHKREDVPSSVRKYLTLPEPGSGRPPLVGDLGVPLRTEYRLWPVIWGVTTHEELHRDPEKMVFDWKKSPYENYAAGCQEELFQLAPGGSRRWKRETKQKPKKKAVDDDDEGPRPMGRPRVHPEEPSSEFVDLDDYMEGLETGKEPEWYKRRGRGRGRPSKKEKEEEQKAEEAARGDVQPEGGVEGVEEGEGAKR